MEDAKNVLEKLKSIIEDEKYQDKENKISLYELKALINEYIRRVDKERIMVLDSLTYKLNNYHLKLYIKKNHVTILRNVIRRIDFEVMDEDIKVVYNDLDIKEPLSLIGREVLNYYNLMYPIDSLNNNVIETDKVKCLFKDNDNIDITIKNTDLTFGINYYGRLNIYYNSLKVMDFVKENEDVIFTSILLDKKNIPTLDVIKERLEKFDQIEKEKQEENKKIKKKNFI